MLIWSRWKITIFLAGVIISMTGSPSSSFAVPHDGIILNCGNCGGVSFSWFHEAGSNPTRGGNFLKKITEGAPIRYEWLPGGLVGATSKQIFNRGSTHILDSAITDGTGNNIAFSVDLWTDHADNRTGSEAGDLNVLSVRPDGEVPAMTVVAGQDATAFNLTHKVSARFGFTITTNDVVIFDEFIFDPTYDMGSVDKIGNDANGGVGTFLWGYTSGHDSSNFFGDNSSTVCLDGSEQACQSFVDALYGVKGIGLDLAYSGTRVSVPEPGTLGLLALGLLGIGLSRRR